jgi:hypothetical protein
VIRPHLGHGAQIEKQPKSWRRCGENGKILARDGNFPSPLGHMQSDPSKKTADAIVGKKSVENADQCPRVTGVTQMPESEVQGRGTVRKLVQDPYCLAYVFANLPDDGSNVAITCPVSGHTFYASVTERL